jgi:HSP20 family protein
MFKNFLKTMLLVTLPVASIQADSNLSKDPFANDPIFQHFQKMQEDMNKIFEEFNHNAFADMKIDPSFSKGFSFSPDTDLKDKGDEYELKMDLPGMDDKSIQIDVQDNYLSVTAKSEESKEQKEDGKIIHQERHVGMIQRGMTLPKDADAHKYKSDYKNGVLTITIPKKK